MVAHSRVLAFTLLLLVNYGAAIDLDVSSQGQTLRKSFGPPYELIQLHRFNQIGSEDTREQCRSVL